MIAKRVRALGNLAAWRGVGLARRVAGLLDRTYAVSDGVPAPRFSEASVPLRARSAPSLDLSGRVAVVTGASGAIGCEIARALSRCGASVAVHYFRGHERADALCKELVNNGTRAMAVQADVTDSASVTSMRDQVIAQLGIADIVVINAVQQYEWTTVLAQPLEDFEGQYRSSVLHAVLMAKAFAPGMIARRHGRIIAISTECAMEARSRQGAYVAGKRGMDGVLRVLAREVGPHQITVNQVAPGWMVTDRDRRAGTERQPEYESRVPLDRRGNDHDVANAVAFLASDLAGFITGAYLPVSGGTVMPAI